MTDLLKLLGDPTCDPRELGPALDDASHKEWRDWLPETLREWYPKDPAGNNHDKAMAIQVVLTNPDVWEDWPLFVAVASALCHRGADFTALEPPTTAELAWACTCMKALNTTHDFHDSTRKFIALSAVHDGLLIFPWAGLNLAEDPCVRGLCSQDAQAVELAHQVQSTFDAVAGSPADDVTHDETSAREASLARLFTIRSFVEAGAKEAA